MLVNLTESLVLLAHKSGSIEELISQQHFKKFKLYSLFHPSTGPRRRGSLRVSLELRASSVDPISTFPNSLLLFSSGSHCVPDSQQRAFLRIYSCFILLCISMIWQSKSSDTPCCYLSHHTAILPPSLHTGVISGIIGALHYYHLLETRSLDAGPVVVTPPPALPTDFSAN